MVDALTKIRYNIKVINGTQMNDTYVQGVVIDVCTRSFLLISDKGDEKWIDCNTPEEFMNVLEVCTSHLNDDQIEYADLAIRGKQV